MRKLRYVIYPEMVIRDETGKIQGVRYEELAPMLLKEVQRQAEQVGELKQQFAEMQKLNLAMQEVLVHLQAKESGVAMH